MLYQLINNYTVHILLFKKENKKSEAQPWLEQFCWYEISFACFDGILYSGRISIQKKMCSDFVCMKLKDALVFPRAEIFCLPSQCLFVPSAEPSEDGRQQKERSPPEHTSACTPPSTPMKAEEGMFCSGGRGSH